MHRRLIREVIRRAGGQVPDDEFTLRLIAAIITHEYRVPIKPWDVAHYLKHSKSIVRRNGYWVMKDDV